MTRFLGLDYGTIRIGLAISDQLGLTAQPLGYINAIDKENTISKIRDLIEAWNVSTIVVGLPLNMNGSEGPAAEKVRKFGNHLASELGIPLVYMDERLTSKQAERILIDADIRRIKRRGKKDSISAALVLQTFLDANKNVISNNL
ncbi:Holliday junction resolvase RuvX [bacterium]|nr:Holliday junction resolvase RuvX [candidate division CSSED10-310 bacterium]